jgi:hypothetical protein
MTSCFSEEYGHHIAVRAYLSEILGSMNTIEIGCSAYAFMTHGSTEICSQQNRKHALNYNGLNTIGGPCIKNVPRAERPTMVGKKRRQSVILEVSPLQPISGFCLGPYNRLFIVLMALWACVPNNER